MLLRGYASIIRTLIDIDVTVVLMILTVPAGLDVHFARTPQLDIAGEGLELEPGAAPSPSEREGEAMPGGPHGIDREAEIEVAIKCRQCPTDVGARGNNHRDVAIMGTQ